MSESFDLVVIGSGPGGEGAAIHASKAERKVALVERHRAVGGGCTHWGTIPSKALRQSIQQLADLKANPLLRSAARSLSVDYPDLLRSAAGIVDEQSRLRRSYFDRNGVELVEGEAAFSGPDELRVQVSGGAARTLRAKGFILATGSRPYRPPEVDFSHPRVLDSDKVLGLKETPASMTIYGAGVVGCEYASIFRSLGTKVNLVNTREKLLTFLDDEIIDAVSYHLRDQGVLLRHGEESARVETADDGVTLHLKSGKSMKTDYLLWANGRAGNTDSLGLDAIGVRRDERGNLIVNESYQTTLPHVYGVGDVIGFPALASAAYDQGRSAATHFVEGKAGGRLARDIPTGIYTIPEISSVGRSERELTRDRVPYEVGHAMFRHLARAQIMGAKVGMLKLLFHRESLRILGVHCFGYQAAEIVHIGQAIMAQPGEANSLMYFLQTTFNYPTMAEAYRVAALNGYNRLRGIVPRAG